MKLPAWLMRLYHYDPWGAVTTYTASGSVDNSTTSIGAINPLRYRSYYYDEETGFYYLQTRYYDPQIGRFINADTYSSTDSQDFLAFNMFSYCGNNPVNQNDEDGTIPKWAVRVIIGTAVIAGAAALTIATAGTGTALACFAAGAFKGAATGAIYGAASGAVTGAIIHRKNTGRWKGCSKSVIKHASRGYMVGAISGFCGGGIKGYAKYKSFGVEKVGRLKASNHQSKKGALGIKYHFNRVKSHNRRVVHSIELHRPHKGGNPHNKWHWQLNRWHKNKSHPLKYRKIWGGKWDDTKH